MTGAQADWLRKNPRYRPTGRTASHTVFADIGILHADGTFERKVKGVAPRVTPGAFEVAIIEHKPPSRQ